MEIIRHAVDLAAYVPTEYHTAVGWFVVTVTVVSLMWLNIGLLGFSESGWIVAIVTMITWTVGSVATAVTMSHGLLPGSIMAFGSVILTFLTILVLELISG